MKILLSWIAFIAIVGAIAFVYLQIWARKMERFCAEHGYRYVPWDDEAKEKATSLVGADCFEFVRGEKRGHTFLFCFRVGENARLSGANAAGAVVRGGVECVSGCD